MDLDALYRSDAKALLTYFVRRTYDVERAGGSTDPVVLRDNLARVRTRRVARPVVLRWTAPDGSPGRFTYPRPR